MKPNITISLNPWYYCNFRCTFCYLSPGQLADKQKIDIDVLRARIHEIKQVYNITHIDLYGGEVNLLPKRYLSQLFQLFEEENIHNVNIITNLSTINTFTLNPAIDVSVSFDFDCRDDSDQVFTRMLMLPRKFSILMLASECLLTHDVDEMINMFNILPNLLSVEIKPYSVNQSNQQNITFSQYEDFIKKWLTSTTKKRFTFINERLIKQSVLGVNHSFSDNHIYITPAGKFAVLEFDLNDRELFTELDDLGEYIEWTNREKAQVLANDICSSCQYVGACLSEHLRDVKDLDHSCNGFKHLITWYSDNVMGTFDVWTERQKLYHETTSHYSDDLNQVQIKYVDDPIPDAITYFYDDSIGWVYPSKSYVVAICYAKWLSALKNVNFYDLLNDGGLLFHNDPHFKTYTQDAHTYDTIITAVTMDFDETIGVIPDIKYYFNQEFFLNGYNNI